MRKIEHTYPLANSRENNTKSADFFALQELIMVHREDSIMKVVVVRRLALTPKERKRKDPFSSITDGTTVGDIPVLGA